MSLKTDFEKKFKEMMTSKGYSLSDSFVTELKDNFLKYESKPSIGKYDKLVGNINEQIADTAEAKIIVKKLCEDFGLKSRAQAKNEKDQNTKKDKNNKEKVETNNDFFKEFDIMAGADLREQSKSKRKDEYDKILDGKRVVENLGKTMQGDIKVAENVTDFFLKLYGATFGKMDCAPVNFVAGTLFTVAGITIGAGSMAAYTVLDGVGRNAIDVLKVGVRSTKKAYKAAKGTTQKMADEKAKKELEFGSKVSKELVKALRESKKQAAIKVDELVDKLNLGIVELNNLKIVDENGDLVESDFGEGNVSLSDLSKLLKANEDKEFIDIAELKKLKLLDEKGEVLKDENGTSIELVDFEGSDLDGIQIDLVELRKLVENHDLTKINKLRGIDEKGKRVEPDLKDIDTYQASLLKRSDQELKELSIGLKIVRTSKLHDELVEIGKHVTPRLESSEIADFINKVKLDKDGMIVYPKGSRINEELFKLYPEIDKEEMEDHIARVAETPDPTKMTDSQIEKLSNNIVIENGEISFDFGDSEVDSVVRKFKNEVEGKALYTEASLGILQSSFHRVTDAHNTTVCLLDEVTEINKYYLARDLANQFTTLKTINEGYERRAEQEELDKKDISNKNRIRRTAEVKVNGMVRLLETDSKTLADIINDKKNKDDMLIEKASVILLKDMKKVASRDQKKVMEYKKQYDTGEKV